MTKSSSEKKQPQEQAKELKMLKQSWIDSTPFLLTVSIVFVIFFGLVICDQTVILYKASSVCSRSDYEWGKCRGLIGTMQWELSGCRRNTTLCDGGMKTLARNGEGYVTDGLGRQTWTTRLPHNYNGNYKNNLMINGKIYSSESLELFVDVADNFLSADECDFWRRTFDDNLHLVNSSRLFKKHADGTIDESNYSRTSDSVKVLELNALIDALLNQLISTNPLHYASGVTTVGKMRKMMEVHENLELLIQKLKYIFNGSIGNAITCKMANYAPPESAKVGVIAHNDDSLHTAIIYLTDADNIGNVDHYGGTNFPALGLRVSAKKGRLLSFSNRASIAGNYKVHGGEPVPIGRKLILQCH